MNATVAPLVDSVGESPRFLICRLSHIGDCVLTLPLVKAIRERYPNAWIAWAMESPTHRLLHGHPDIDQIVLVPKGWLSSWTSIRSVRRELKKLEIDISVDPQCLAKSSLLARLSGAAIRLGFRGKYGRELSTWFNNQTIEPRSDHLVDRSLELAQCLGCPGPSESQAVVNSPVFDLQIQDSARQSVQDFLGRTPIADRPFVVINPGASWESKRWENDRFAQVARQLYVRTCLPTVVTWAGQEEHLMARQINRLAPEATVVACQTSLGELAALLQRAELFIGCDTGPLHIAAAVGTTCVGLHGPTRPQDSGAFGPQHYSIQKKYHAGSARQRRTADNSAMRAIEASDVVDVGCRALARLRIQQDESNRNPVTSGTRKRNAA